MTETTHRKRCPICGRPADAKLAPFCSSRCSNVDLHRWLSGGYAIPATETDDDEGTGATRSQREDGEV